MKNKEKIILAGFVSSPTLVVIITWLMTFAGFDLIAVMHSNVMIILNGLFVTIGLLTLLTSIYDKNN